MLQCTVRDTFKVPSNGGRKQRNSSFPPCPCFFFCCCAVYSRPAGPQPSRWFSCLHLPPYFTVGIPELQMRATTSRFWGEHPVPQIVWLAFYPSHLLSPSFCLEFLCVCQWCACGCVRVCVWYVGVYSYKCMSVGKIVGINLCVHRCVKLISGVRVWVLAWGREYVFMCAFIHVCRHTC